MTDTRNKMINSHKSHADSSKKFLRSFKAEKDAQRSISEKFADFMTRKFGSVGFLILNVLWFAVWIFLNSNIIGGIEPFDPFPFGLLTMIVSLEAIALAIVVLISQNRAEKIQDLRQEIDLQFDMTSESEITEVIKLLKILLLQNGIDLSNDPDVKEMIRPVTLEKFQKILEEEIK